jgi:hypothetical protein
MSIPGRDLPAERGDFDDFCAELDVREAEAASDNPAVPKELFDLVGLRGCPHVEVLRTTAEKQVADRSTHEIGDMPVLVEPIKHFEGVGINVAAGD